MVRLFAENRLVRDCVHTGVEEETNEGTASETYGDFYLNVQIRLAVLRGVRRWH